MKERKKNEFTIMNAIVCGYLIQQKISEVPHFHKYLYPLILNSLHIFE